MGKRRRKLLRRKYSKLPWNKYGDNLPEEQGISEQKINKVVEDNSVVLERMKNVSSSCDKILQTIDSIEPSAAAVLEPYFMSTEPIPELEEPESSVEMKIQPFNEPTLIAPETSSLKKMLKKDLLKMAQEKGCNVKSTMTKANIIKAIEATK